jgi:hypothetical protein
MTQDKTYSKCYKCHKEILKFELHFTDKFGKWFTICTECHNKQKIYKILKI